MTPDVDEALEVLLQPVPGPDPCGLSLRADALMTDIRLAREEEDPTLPMRQWERPLKRADWTQIETLCAEALATRSKDLQLAAWLAEAWTRQPAGMAGLARGLGLMRELVARYWEGLHPQLDPPEDGGGCEARLAPLEWMDGALAHTLRVFVVLLPLADRKPDRVSLADWERLVAGELSQAPEPLAPDDASEPPLTRDDILGNVARHQPAVVDARLGEVREARAHLEALRAILDERLGPQSPPLRHLGGVLDALERVLVQVRAALPQRAAGPAPASAVPHDDSAMQPTTADDAVAPVALPTPVAHSGWRSREEAYQTLDALAQYLASIEPHSPTPYLIQRAVNWGRLPLPDLMAEIMREEGDLNRMVQLLGLGR